MKNRVATNKQVSIDTDLHAPFKSYCSGVQQRSVKSVVSEIVREKLQKANFHIGDNGSQEKEIKENQ